MTETMSALALLVAYGAAGADSSPPSTPAGAPTGW